MTATRSPGTTPRAARAWAKREESRASSSKPMISSWPLARTRMTAGRPLAAWRSMHSWAMFMRSLSPSNKAHSFSGEQYAWASA